MIWILISITLDPGLEIFHVLDPVDPGLEIFNVLDPVDSGQEIYCGSIAQIYITNLDGEDKGVLSEARKLEDLRGVLHWFLEFLFLGLVETFLSGEPKSRFFVFDFQYFSSIFKYMLFYAIFDGG